MTINTTLRTIPSTMIWNRPVEACGESCQVCGRPVSENAVGVIVVDGGASIIHPEDQASLVSDAGYMGWWPIGSECAKKIPAEYLCK